MEWVETTGKSVEEAQEAALDELGVDAQDAEFEVLEEPKVGLFGRMRAEARIRARVRPTTPRAKEDRRDRRRRPKSDAAQSATTEAPTVERPGRSARNGASRSESDVRSAAVAGDGVVTSEAADLDGETATTAPPRPRTNPSRHRRGRGGTRPGASGPGDGAAPGEAAGTDTSIADKSAGTDGSRGTSGRTPSDEHGQDSPAGGPKPARSRSRKRPSRSSAANDDGADAAEGTLMDVALDEQGKVAEQFLAGLMDSFGLSAEIAVTVPDDDTIDIQVTGGDLGLLIGPKGATLLAIQDITRTVVQRKTSAGNGRIFVDVGGYRQKRNEALSRFAQKVAADVIASQSRVAMEPMSAPDRKTVHDTITDIEGVETVSEGEDAARHIVVLPAGA